MSVFDKVMKGLDEAIEYQRGNRKGARVSKIKIEPVKKYSAVEIKKIRANLNLSQRVFADLLGVSPKSVEAWESGKNTPQGSSLRLIELIQKDHNIVSRFYHTD